MVSCITLTCTKLITYLAASLVTRFLLKYPMKQALFIILLSIICHTAQAQVITLNNFNKNTLGDWTLGRETSMVSLVLEKTNGYIHISDTDDKLGSSVDSPIIPAVKGIYTGKMRVRQFSGMGFGMQVHAYDHNRQYLRNIGSVNLSSRAPNTNWYDIQCKAYVDSDDIGFVQIRFGSWSKSIIEIDCDDVSLTFEPATITPPKWEPQYKIKPVQTDRLTAADVVGPDGIVYPNWTRAGMAGGIPNTFKNTVKLSDFGGLPNDGKDDAHAIELAVSAVARHGGGLVQLDAGQYDMMRPVIIRDSNITIAGCGVDQTHIDFRYVIEPGKVVFWGVQDGQTVGPKSNLVAFAPPGRFKSFELQLDGQKCGSFHPSQHSGNRSFVSAVPSNKSELFTQGKHQLTAIASYLHGTTKSQTITVNYDPSHVDESPIGIPDGAIAFHGKGFDSDQYRLASDAKRGQNTITLSPGHDLAVGQWIFIRANETPARRALVRNACNWGIYRNYQVKITKVDNNTITIDRPLRIDFPVADESYVMRLGMIENCGVRDLTIEQTQDMWLTGVMFNYAANCWAQRVNVIKCGRHPVYANNASQCEIRDCDFTEAWFKGGGGTAYVGWEKSYDCLMENVTTTNMRHAPLFQWSAAGNVIRDSMFHNSDAQWHSGWTNENLMENCVITSVKGNGGYGYGMWASPPEDGAHGPNGPRNVVYNCDVSSSGDGMWVGGMNENWLILHNRFVVDNGIGFFTKDHSFDHIIKDNIFILKDAKSPMVKLLSGDCTGVEIIGNQLYGGNGQFVNGLGATEIVQSNTAHPLPETLPQRPQLAVPSIFQWQRQH